MSRTEFFQGMREAAARDAAGEMIGCGGVDSDTQPFTVGRKTRQNVTRLNPSQAAGAIPARITITNWARTGSLYRD